ncbi:unnamed protein product [Orchesella dallaii]|uniref:Uncharacterized protein n=1 Tax=Orchesella dallaii TaxID=48710 RepID=A0ABP1PJM2_9HEXA
MSYIMKHGIVLDGIQYTQKNSMHGCHPSDGYSLVDRGESEHRYRHENSFGIQRMSRFFLSSSSSFVPSFSLSLFTRILSLSSWMRIEKMLQNAPVLKPHIQFDNGKFFLEHYGRDGKRERERLSFTHIQREREMQFSLR